MKIHGKEYMEVKDRIKIFRKDFKSWSLTSKILQADIEIALIQAYIKDQNDRVVATGIAFERADDKKSMINKSSHIENCETSAWGRALANLGIGIDGSIASYEEVRIAKQSNGFDFDYAIKLQINTPQELYEFKSNCNKYLTNINKQQQEDIKNKIRKLTTKMGEK